MLYVIVTGRGGGQRGGGVAAEPIDHPDAVSAPGERAGKDQAGRAEAGRARRASILIPGRSGEPPARRSKYEWRLPVSGEPESAGSHGAR